ncbi:hypothetical protein A3J32_01555 [Candidatus Saccharibacteria bacterium RIFCSPLOWO2_02_FULL_46_7]|nr:MAG: hypothetical protein A3J32_01555 [Candidatus Saccharibacteria bacterium RIFCSPLOWO2_02_FULL_46_7]
MHTISLNPKTKSVKPEKVYRSPFTVYRKFTFYCLRWKIENGSLKTHEKLCTENGKRLVLASYSRW